MENKGKPGQEEEKDILCAKNALANNSISFFKEVSEMKIVNRIADEKTIGVFCGEIHFNHWKGVTYLTNINGHTQQSQKEARRALLGAENSGFEGALCVGTTKGKIWVSSRIHHVVC